MKYTKSTKKERMKVINAILKDNYKNNKFLKRFLCAYHWSLNMSEKEEEKWESFRIEYINMSPVKKFVNYRKKMKILKKVDIKDLLLVFIELV